MAGLLSSTVGAYVRRMLPRAIAMFLTLASALEAGAQEPRGTAAHVVASVPVPVSRFRERPDGFTQYSGIADSLRVVIRDRDAWRAYWSSIHRPFIPAPPAPDVDFSREMIIVASMGLRPSAGFAIRIENATADPSRLIISVRQTVPGTGCALGAALTQPVDLARVPATPLPVFFADRVERADCSGAPAPHRR